MLRPHPAAGVLFPEFCLKSMTLVPNDVWSGKWVKYRVWCQTMPRPFRVYSDCSEKSPMQPQYRTNPAAPFGPSQMSSTIISSEYDRLIQQSRTWKKVYYICRSGWKMSSHFHGIPLHFSRWILKSFQS
jgi:hypothetical protein